MKIAAVKMPIAATARTVPEIPDFALGWAGAGGGGTGVWLSSGCISPS